MAVKGWRARFEASIFDQLAQNVKPIDIAAKEGVSIQTVYAIDRREAQRRGVDRNLGKEKASGA